MKKLFNIFLVMFFCSLFFLNVSVTNVSYAADTTKKYYTVYLDETKKDVLFLKGDDVSKGDKYLSKDNKLYEIISVDDNDKSAYVKFIRDEKLQAYNVTRKTSDTKKEASAAKVKKVGIYHTHNDECYFTPDGVDSVYGEGGIHDVGAAFSKNLNNLGIETVYRKDLHLPHNSGAYNRSQVTASEILKQGVDGIFDLHRDSTKRSEYLTKVDGKEMSSVRMVVGSASANFEENKKFAYSIKSYADSVYPGLIKDIYFGKGNYNQQLSTRAMLFEMGCENIEKDYAIKATNYLAKVVDAVLYGSSGASQTTLNEVSLVGDNGENTELVGLVSDNGTAVNSNSTLSVVLWIVGIILAILTIVLLVSKKARYKVGRFFSEMFAGIFGRKAHK